MAPFRIDFITIFTHLSSIDVAAVSHHNNTEGSVSRMPIVFTYLFESNICKHVESSGEEKSRKYNRNCERHFRINPQFRSQSKYFPEAFSLFNFFHVSNVYLYENNH